jgi:hypothetical protein
MFFASVETELDDEENIAQAIKAVETLTEFCQVRHVASHNNLTSPVTPIVLTCPLWQGNVSMANAKMLCDSKLIDVCGRLVLVQTLPGVDDKQLDILRGGA